MSRAFVKEDERGGATFVIRSHGTHPNYVTPAGIERLQDDLAAAQAAGTAQRAEYLEARLKTMIVVDPPAGTPECVAFGTVATVREPSGAEHRYAIVGEDEADPLRGRISWTSPLGQALVDARVGECVDWRRPAGAMPLTILAIERAK